MGDASCWPRQSNLSGASTQCRKQQNHGFKGDQTLPTRFRSTGGLYLMVSRAKPATGGEIHGALGPCCGIQQGVVTGAVHPGAANYEVVGFAIGRHQ